MILYSGPGPSAKTVRMFLAEKGVSPETVDVDLLRREHLSGKLLALNPEAQYPVLVFDDGGVLAESLAICEFIEEMNPLPALIGADARERAETRMWCRRIDLRIMEPGIQAFKATAGREFFKDRYLLVTEGAEQLAALSEHNKRWLDRHLDAREFICGDRFSLADIQLFCFMQNQADNGLPPACTALANWYRRIAARVSASS